MEAQDIDKDRCGTSFHKHLFCAYFNMLLNIRGCVDGGDGPSWREGVFEFMSSMATDR